MPTAQLYNRKTLDVLGTLSFCVASKKMQIFLKKTENNFSYAKRLHSGYFPLQRFSNKNEDILHSELYTIIKSVTAKNETRWK